MPVILSPSELDIRSYRKIVIFKLSVPSVAHPSPVYIFNIQGYRKFFWYGKGLSKNVGLRGWSTGKHCQIIPAKKNPKMA